MPRRPGTRDKKDANRALVVPLIDPMAELQDSFQVHVPSGSTPNGLRKSGSESSPPARFGGDPTSANMMIINEGQENHHNLTQQRPQNGHMQSHSLIGFGAGTAVTTALGSAAKNGANGSNRAEKTASFNAGGLAGSSNKVSTAAKELKLGNIGQDIDDKYEYYTSEDEQGRRIQKMRRKRRQGRNQGNGQVGRNRDRRGRSRDNNSLN